MLEAKRAAEVAELNERNKMLEADLAYSSRLCPAGLAFQS